jgi:hypothetical protein
MWVGMRTGLHRPAGGTRIGDWLYNVAMLALVYERTHSPTWLAATTAARVLPVVTGALLTAGSLVLLTAAWLLRRPLVVTFPAELAPTV